MLAQAWIALTIVGSFHLFIVLSVALLSIFVLFMFNTLNFILSVTRSVPLCTQTFQYRVHKYVISETQSCLHKCLAALVYTWTCWYWLKYEWGFSSCLLPLQVAVTGAPPGQDPWGVIEDAPSLGASALLSHVGEKHCWRLLQNR